MRREISRAERIFVVLFLERNGLFEVVERKAGLSEGGRAAGTSAAAAV